MTFYLGLDLGQSQDYTALAVGEQATGVLRLRRLKRYQLGTPYPVIVQEVCNALRHPDLGKHPALIVDATGVGQPVVEMFHERRVVPYAVKIHGGDKVSTDGVEYRIPKRDLATNLQVYFQEKKLEIVPGIPEADTLIEELLNFKVKINAKTAHDSYEAWREGQHDDLVLAVAMACWFAENVGSYVGADLSANTEGWPDWED